MGLGGGAPPSPLPLALGLLLQRSLLASPLTKSGSWQLPLQQKPHRLMPLFLTLAVAQRSPFQSRFPHQNPVIHNFTAGIKNCEKTEKKACPPRAASVTLNFDSQI